MKQLPKNIAAAKQPGTLINDSKQTPSKSPQMPSSNVDPVDEFDDPGLMLSDLLRYSMLTCTKIKTHPLSN